MPDKFQTKVQSASDKELLMMLSESNHDSPNWNCICDEIQLRRTNQIGKVHWFQHVANVAAVVAAIASIVSAWQSWHPAAQSELPKATQIQRCQEPQSPNKKIANQGVLNIFSFLTSHSTSMVG